jgi:hypothetical protein
MSDYYKKTKLNDTNGKLTYAFRFENLSDAQRFTDEKLQTIAPSNQLYPLINRFTDQLEATVRQQINSYGTDWFGTRDSSWARGEITQFTDNTRLGNEINTLTDAIGRVDVIDIDQKKKIEFTEKEVGIFSFDLASLGLIRVYKFYSPYLMEYVDKNLVQSYKTDSGETIFYYVGTPYIPRHEVPFSLKKGFYYSEILKRKVEPSELEEVVPDNIDEPIKFYYPEKKEIPKHNVKREQEVDENGNKKFASTYKKCFIDIPKVKGNLPRIDLIVPVSFASGVTGDQIFWNTISILAVANKLSTSGVNYQILGFYGNETDLTKTFSFIKLKDDTEPLDMNSLAITIGDARFFRTADFKLSWAQLIDMNRQGDVYSGVGRAITDVTEIKRKYLEFLSKQTSESDQEASNNPNSKIMIPRATSNREATSSYNTVIQQISGLLTI